MFGNMMRYGTEAAQRGYGGRYFNGGQMPYVNNSAFFTIHWVLGFITWVLVIAVLVALARWLWLKGDQEKRNRR